MEQELKPWVQSSSNPAQVANTVKGGVLALSSVVIALAGKVFDIELTPENVLELATQAGILAGAVWTIYGVAMKVVMWFGRKRG